MTPFTTLTAKACPLQLSNVDTDQLIPARFMKRSRAEGYGPVLMYDLRFDENSALKQEFILNQPLWNECGILVAGRNFGGGSSREAAVYALVDYGIRCVIAPSFGDIFSSNAVNNGLLPARLNETACDEICNILQQSSTSLSIDLPNQLIQAGEKQFSFDIDPVWRTKLINGWDDISLTQSYADDIAAFADATHRQRPWNQPNQSLEQAG